MIADELIIVSSLLIFLGSGNCFGWLSCCQGICNWCLR